jgi:exoribonuclease R
MNNDHYEQIFTKHIESLYGPRINDETLLDNNPLPHEYCINTRDDFTHINTYSIDPEGCEDADDAFSIYFEDTKLWLAIHIADPTELINIKSPLWQDIENKIITKYPSNRKPIHMLPDKIMEMASLMENDYGNIKKAITIKTEIDKETYLPINRIKILFTNIKVKKENSLSYIEASTNIDTILPLEYGLKISEKLQEKRSKKTIGVKLNKMNASIIKYKNNIPYLYNNTPNEKKMKDMIGEFAIFANSFIGEYLKIYFNEYGIFRTCAATEFINNSEYAEMNGAELLHEIIINGINAEYVNKCLPHDLVGSEEYTHFTSPIRRASDCICHYLLKYIQLNPNRNNNPNIKKPFSIDKLQELSNQCIINTTQNRKIQYKENKFRLIQIINTILITIIPVKITYYISSYISNYLNIIINRINNYNVHLSYTLRIADYNYNSDNKTTYELNITRVKCPGKFDQGSIPELDKQFI